jgi:hypothetical protein
MNYKIKRIDSESISDFLKLYKIVFGKTRDENYQKAKYATSSFGATNLGYLAYSEDNEVAAYYGILPVIAQLNDQSFLAAQSGDTMTHPNHQGKGLFVTLAKKTYEFSCFRKKRKCEKLSNLPSSPTFHQIIDF